MAPSLSSSDLHKYLIGEMRPAEVKELIGDRVSEFRDALSKKGASAPIQMETEGELFVVANDQVQRLCDDYLQDRLTEIDVDYLATALELSEDFVFTSKIVEEAVFLLTDPVANGPLTKDSVHEVRSKLLDTYPDQNRPA